MGRVRTGPPTEIQPVVLQWKQTVLVSGTLLGRLIFFASENDSLRLHFFTAATTATLPESTLHLATDCRCPLLAASARDLRVAIGSDTGKTPTGRKQTTRQRKRSDQQERRRLFAGEVQGARFHTIFSNDDPSISPDSVPTTGRTDDTPRPLWRATGVCTHPAARWFGRKYPCTRKEMRLAG